ncbi:GumC family protein [Mucilaginibacter sp. HD30]
MASHSSVSSVPVEENDSFDLNNILSRYLSHWYWFVLSVLTFLLIGFIYILFQPPMYEIKGKLLIRDNAKANTGNAPTAASLNGFDLFSSGKVLDNEIELLKSSTFLERTIKDLHLETNVLFKENLNKVDLYANSPLRVNLVKPKASAFEDYIELTPVSATDFSIDGKTYHFNTLVSTPYGSFIFTQGKSLNKYIGKTLLLQVNDIEDLIDYYNGSLSVEQASSQGSILVLSLKDAVPQRGKDFITKLIDVYNINSIDDKNRITSVSLRFIEERIDSIARELTGVEKNVEQYKSSNNITDISNQSRIYLESQRENDATLNRVLIQLNVIQDLENYLQGKQNTGLPSTLNLDDPTLNGLVRQLSETLNNRQSLLRTIPEGNPIIQSIDDQISLLKKSVYAGVQNIKSGLLITRNRLQTKGNQFESVMQKVPAKERGLIDVMRQQDIKNNLFIYLLEKREETSLALASNISSSHVVDTPRSGKHPVSPKKTISYLVFLFLGLIFPVVVLFIKDVLNYRITARRDIERITSVPVIAEISYSRDKTALPVTERPRSIVAEQIRSLRTNLSAESGNIAPKTILFTSSVSGEGKSFVSLNIGASLAATGKKVLIIELDMRKPKLHTNLNIENRLGLSDFITGELNRETIIQPVVQQPGYFIITCGTIPPNPAELLISNKLDLLIDQLRMDFDHILFDAPPIGLVTDAQILERFAEATMFIVRDKYTLKKDVQIINRFFVRRKFKNMSIIFNAIAAEGERYNGGYGYYEEPTEERSWYKRVFQNKAFK